MWTAVGIAFCAACRRLVKTRGGDPPQGFSSLIPTRKSTLKGRAGGSGRGPTWCGMPKGTRRTLASSILLLAPLSLACSEAAPSNGPGGGTNVANGTGSGVTAGDATTSVTVATGAAAGTSTGTTGANGTATSGATSVGMTGTASGVVTGSETSSTGSGGASGSVGGTSSASGTTGQLTTGGTGPAEVRLIGRMDLNDVNGPRFAWSGSGMLARFEGTEVGVTLSSGQYTVLIDGQLQPTLVASGALQSLATGLSAGSHLVELYRRTEASQGVAQFLGFDFGTGTLLSPPAAATRRLEVVGDSISCGYGVDGADMNCPFSAETENHYASYAAIAARNLNAELITIAWSGKGVVCNYGDDATSCVDPLPGYYERTLPQQSNSTWDFGQWQADAVVINLGTNDFSTEQDPSQQEFESGYAALLQNIRSKYQNAWILCTNGPMLSGTDLTNVRTYIQNVVSDFNDAGDSKVTAFELMTQDGTDGYGCDWHPSAATHVKMAEQLTSTLESTLGW